MVPNKVRHPFRGMKPTLASFFSQKAARAFRRLSSALCLTNRSANDLNPILIAFGCRIQQDTRIRINGKPTYMSLLRAMITLSIKDFTSTYDGGAFSFQDYSNVRIVTWSAYAQTTPLQYRYVIYGLYEAMKRISVPYSWFDTTITLYWIGPGGTKTHRWLHQNYPKPRCRGN